MEHTVLDKDTIKNLIMPYLSVAKRGYASKFDLVEIIQAIIYKLKSGCQWAYLPIGHLFSGEDKPSYKTVFHHYRKWCKNGDWQTMFTELLKRYKGILDLSSSHIDGSHTPAKRGGECVEYQGRKKTRTTNALYLSDNAGIPLAMSEPQSGNHADLFEIKDRVDELMKQLTDASIETDGLFTNADAGFDGKEYRRALESHGVFANVCPNRRNGEPSEDYLFDPELYSGRWVVERTNAWMDGFRSILNRFDTTVSSWKGWNYLAFAIVLLKKFHKSKKFR